jgi:3-methyladenine DNA glycosylase Tag
MTRTVKKNGAGATRRAAGLMRDIERSVDGMLGADEAARRTRHYVADHDAPADDHTAYARLCAVVFAQGLGFGAVDARREHFAEAFAGFAPEKVAAFDDDRVALVLQAPIIRNEVKIRACVENARHWVGAAGDAAYLSRVARFAVDDDAASGWPALTQMLQEDFVRIGETAARQALKRWGFFTAYAHPGSRRVMERLQLIAGTDSPAAVQCFLGAVARIAGRDPYQLEATLALFASLGTCKREPECGTCVLVEKCPTASARAANGPLIVS